MSPEPSKAAHAIALEHKFAHKFARKFTANSSSRLP